MKEQAAGIEQYGDASFYYYFMVKGYREKETALDPNDNRKKAKNEDDAIKFRKDRKKMVEFMLAGKIPPDEKVAKFLEKQAGKDVLTVDFLCQALIDDYSRKGNKTTGKAITHTEFFRYYFKEKKKITDIKDIRKKDVLDMLDELSTHDGRKGKNLSSGTRNRYLSSLRRAFNSLKEDEEIDFWRNPCDGIKKSTEGGNKRKRIIPPDKEQKFFASFPVPQCHIVEFYFQIGVRISNVFLLNKSQIDLESERLYLEPDENKGKKPVVKKLNKRAMKILMMYYDKADFYIFTHQKGKFMGKPFTRIDKAWATACAAVGISESTPHDGRRSFGTKVYKKTKNPYMAQKLLDHSSLEVTKLYIDIDQEEEDEVMDGLND